MVPREIAFVCLIASAVTGSVAAEPDFASTIDTCLSKTFLEAIATAGPTAPIVVRETARSLGWASINDLALPLPDELMEAIAEEAEQEGLTTDAYLNRLFEAGVAIPDVELAEAMTPVSKLFAFSLFNAGVPEDYLAGKFTEYLASENAGQELSTFGATGAEIFLSDRDVRHVLNISHSARGLDCHLASTDGSAPITRPDVLLSANDEFVSEAVNSDFYSLRSFHEIPDSAWDEEAYQMVWSRDTLERYVASQPESFSLLWTLMRQPQ